MYTSIAPCAATGHHTPAVVPQGPSTLPEAPVSLNCFVEVPGLGRVQVTGRGYGAHSEAEAVAHLLLASEQLKAQTQPQGPPPPPTREEQIAQLLTKGLACAVAKGDWKLIDKLSKAAALVLNNAIEATDSPTIWAVRSSQDAEHWYEVTKDSYVCTCPDWNKHYKKGDHKYLCKHGTALAMFQRI